MTDTAAVSTGKALTNAQKRSRAYSLAERRLRDTHAALFARLLREELARFGLEPLTDRRRAKAERDLAAIRAEFPDLLNEAADNAPTKN
jgi:hypothetical protein